MISNSQNTSWEEFLTGNFAFAENGTWQVDNAAKAGFPTGVIQIPGENGGVAPTPTGGEFITVPVQDDTSRYDVTKKIVECMTTTDGLVETAEHLRLLHPADRRPVSRRCSKDEAGAARRGSTAVNTAKGRTSDNLGTKYPKISEALWTAVQSAMSGAATPEAGTAGGAGAGRAGHRLMPAIPRATATEG